MPHLISINSNPIKASSHRNTNIVLYSLVQNLTNTSFKGWTTASQAIYHDLELYFLRALEIEKIYVLTLIMTECQLVHTQNKMLL